MTYCRFLTIIIACTYLYSDSSFATNNCSPKSLANYQTLSNTGFTVAWSNEDKIPLWVSYSLHYPWRYRLTHRPRFFSPDKRTVQTVTGWDYSGSGYDRGHLAPNYAITRNYGKKAQKQTFLTSNISPMRKSLNRKLWQRIEEAITTHILPKHRAIHIITGPVFSPDDKYTRKGIRIPSAFYKIISNNQYTRNLAFLVPQSVTGTESLNRFVTTIKNIEDQTNIEFFPCINAQRQKHLKNTINTSYWQLNKYSNLPPRY